MTFLVETEAKLLVIQRTSDEIIFIGSADYNYSCTWEEFKTLANINYSAGFGAPEIAKDLIIIFNDGASMTREEYDGSEWWRYNEVIKLPPNLSPQKIKRLSCENVFIGWETVHTLQTEYLNVLLQFRGIDEIFDHAIYKLNCLKRQYEKGAF